ncbi:MAG TPA: hypothetical protein VFW02_03130 [Candidatus Limnocylindrales bacterium]|nr:hypothetical protein [Candidatus Limnocylindrales bacterium]
MPTTRSIGWLVRATAALTVAGSTLVLSTPAFGHEPRSFDACAAYRQHGGPCEDIATYLYGDRVILRATVGPPHPHLEANVLYLRPGAERWRRGVTVPISDTGRMRWSFRSVRADADQTEPWLFRFRIAGHGRSDVVETFILFGE